VPVFQLCARDHRGATLLDMQYGHELLTDLRYATRPNLIDFCFSVFRRSRIGRAFAPLAAADRLHHRRPLPRPATGPRSLRCLARPTPSPQGVAAERLDQIATIVVAEHETTAAALFDDVSAGAARRRAGAACG
jgi:hypothetical protein